MRLAGSGGDVSITADADPAPLRCLTARDLLGRVERAPPRRVWSGTLVRTFLDLREAIVAGPDAVGDRAETVRDKYDDQAVHYDRPASEGIEERLAARILDRVPRGGRVLVAGSGAGREAFALERLGFRVTGVDFSPRMVAAAQAEAVQRGSSVTFVEADLRSHDEAPSSFVAVVFTYDVYSFVPGRDDREALLRRLCGWLVPGGVLFLSARRTHGAWDRAVLSLQWLARAARGGSEAWGDSHTRWLDASGTLRRSFVHVFTDRRLDREASAAALRRVSWEGGHGVFESQRGFGAGSRT